MEKASREADSTPVGEMGGGVRKSKREFSEFLDNSKHYGSLGVLHKETSRLLLRKTQSYFPQEGNKPNWNTSINTQTKSLFGKSFKYSHP